MRGSAASYSVADFEKTDVFIRAAPPAGRALTDIVRQLDDDDELGGATILDPLEGRTVLYPATSKPRR